MDNYCFQFRHGFKVKIKRVTTSLHLNSDQSSCSGNSCNWYEYKLTTTAFSVWIKISTVTFQAYRGWLLKIDVGWSITSSASRFPDNFKMLFLTCVIDYPTGSVIFIFCLTPPVPCFNWGYHYNHMAKKTTYIHLASFKFCYLPS